MDLKLVDYSESSGSTGGEDQQETKCKKIAVIQPVQHHQPVPEPEVNPEESPFPIPLKQNQNQIFQLLIFP